MPISAAELLLLAEEAEDAGHPAGIPIFLEGETFVAPEGNSRASQKLQGVAQCYSREGKKPKRKKQVVDDDDSSSWCASPRTGVYPQQKGLLGTSDEGSS